MGSRRIGSSGVPPAVTIRHLATHTSAVIGEVVETRRATVVTRSGRPVAVIVPVDDQDIADAAAARWDELTRAQAKGRPRRER